MRASRFELARWNLQTFQRTTHRTGLTTRGRRSYLLARAARRIIRTRPVYCSECGLLLRDCYTCDLPF